MMRCRDLEKSNRLMTVATKLSEATLRNGRHAATLVGAWLGRKDEKEREDLFMASQP